MQVVKSNEVHLENGIKTKTKTKTHLEVNGEIMQAVLLQIEIIAVGQSVELQQLN